jgi:hypothetical protein
VKYAMRRVINETLDVVVMLLVCISTSAQAQCVKVKYYPGDCIDLAQFRCTDTKSSFVHQVCYDKKTKFMVLRLKDARYPHCNTPEEVVKGLIEASSVGSYYNRNIKGKSFDCRIYPVPKYPTCGC